jgi:integrase
MRIPHIGQGRLAMKDTVQTALKDPHRLGYSACQRPSWLDRYLTLGEVVPAPETDVSNEGTEHTGHLHHPPTTLSQGGTEMARKRKNGRVYWRSGRAYGDFRDLGGGREALKAPGDKLATTDPDVAAKLASDRVAELEEQKRNRGLGITPNDTATTLKAYAAYHLLEKAKAGKVSDRWMQQAELRLRAAIDFFPKGCPLTAIDVKMVQRYVDHLRTYPNRRGGTLSEGSQRHYLNSLSNLFKRALSEGEAQLNPVAALMDKPRGQAREADWLEAHEVALLLESARTFKPDPDAHAVPIYPILATLFLTGARVNEALGLRVDDVSFQRKRIHFRPNKWRTLKTKGSERVVRLWPQLEEILRAYIMEREQSKPLNELLFPSPLSESDSLIKDFRKALDRVAARCGWEPGEVRAKAARHSYCAARLQTVEHGYPVAPFTVSRELGHVSTAMVEAVYSHLGEIRHRSEVVEFRIEHHRDVLADKLEAL